MKYLTNYTRLIIIRCNKIRQFADVEISFKTKQLYDDMVNSCDDLKMLSRLVTPLIIKKSKQFIIDADTRLYMDINGLKTLEEIFAKLQPIEEEWCKRHKGYLRTKQ